MKIKIQKIVLMLASVVAIHSCGLWPYKSDFDCKIPEGERCKSLYEVNSLTDSGKYAPEVYFKEGKQAEEVKKCGKNCPSKKWLKKNNKYKDLTIQ